LRGGIRQRIAKSEAIEAEQNDEPADRPLNRTMKKKWGKGRISAKDAAEVFDAAREQGAVGIPKLSSMDHPQNLHRSLVSAFGHPAGAPEFFWSMIPLKSGKTSHPFLLPHMWFAALFGMMRSWWDTAVRGPVGGNTKVLEQHPSDRFFQIAPWSERR